MQLIIDEQEQGHVYTCLLVAGEKFGKAKKDLEKLDMDVAAIEEQLGINAKLKRIFNPRAEEEARAKSRANDPAQMDLTEAGSSGETGGGVPSGQTFTLNTGAAITSVEMRDALMELGIAVMLEDIEAWSIEEARLVGDFIEASRAAVAGLGPEPEAPECVEHDGMSVVRLREFLAAGPYSVEEVPSGDEGFAEFEVCCGAPDGGDIQVESTHSDKLDAEIEAARCNRDALRTAHMTDDEILDWAGKGPWTVAGDGDGEGDNFWHIVAGTQKEECESEMDAMGRAARYNRSIAQRPLPQADYEIVDEHADIGEKEVEVTVGRAD